MPNFLTMSYTERAAHHTNQTAKDLLTLMDRKKTNLSIAADVVSKDALLKLADTFGPYICVFKTHIDIITDFDEDLITQLKALSEKHDFLIFEDRKFADIGKKQNPPSQTSSLPSNIPPTPFPQTGNTVVHQYASGIYKIASWSHITNAHPIPGEGIIKGLASVGLNLFSPTTASPLSRGLLLLAEMSSAGALTTGTYPSQAYTMACKNRDFVFGFIGQRRLSSEGTEEGDEPDFVYLTPGVQMASKGDDLGQQYRTPEEVVLESGCDVIIVGRGLYGAKDSKKAAEEYRRAGWNAYLKRIGMEVEA
ncbi:orotidine 5'-phosphate decarboxylase [Rhizophlyctis rosea]|uniref:Orotidine 5'-phosphate decarboxylase n=1 Tax=Rhizophlyctis rosea TaxID=64517 RepID=A0AAD5X1P4_9FUNG|nr:orotidine 5'-phosphate decarboxylase [Rhizophlyctis rosea]